MGNFVNVSAYQKFEELGSVIDKRDNIDGQRLVILELMDNEHSA